MDNPILSSLTANSNALNRECQQFQKQIKEIMNNIMQQTQLSDDDKEMYEQQMNAVCNEYSSSINRLEYKCLIKCERYLESMSQSGRISSQLLKPASSTGSGTSQKKTAKMFVCDECGAVYTARSSLTRHQRKAHSSTDNETSISNKNQAVSPTEEAHKDTNSIVADKSLKECPDCYKMIKYQGFYQHKMMHERQRANNDKVSNTKIKRAAKFVECEVCGEQINCRGYYQHKKMHQRRAQASEQQPKTAEEKMSPRQTLQSMSAANESDQNNKHDEHASNSPKNQVDDILLDDEHSDTASDATSDTNQKKRKLKLLNEAELNDEEFEVDPPFKRRRIMQNEQSGEEKEKEEEVQKLYCICRQPYEAGRAMVQCDRCAEWYHCDCQGLKEEDAKKLDEFKCSNCLKSMYNPRL